MAGEARPEDPERPLDAAAQIPERPGTEPLGLLRPLLQPAGLGTVPVACREAGGMGHEPQQHKVGVDLPGEHRFEVELEVRLARQGLVVPQDPQAKAVRHDRPEVCVAAVEVLLNQAMRIGGSGPPLSCGAAIERKAAADKVNWRRTEETADGIRAAAKLGAGGHRQKAESQFPQQRQAPLVVGESGARHTVG